MNFWLIKSEPDVFSYQKLEQDGKTNWDGVRNYQARNNLRAMRLGDLCLFYHSNIGLEVVGIARVGREHFPDPTAESGDWSAVEMQPFKAFSQTVSLKDIKAHPDLQQILLVRNGRISVSPLTEKEFSTILEMGKTSL